MVHSFGRAETVDREALSRLVRSISRFLTPEQALIAASGAEVEVLDSRRLGGVYALDRLWRRLGIGELNRFATLENTCSCTSAQVSASTTRSIARSA